MTNKGILVVLSGFSGSGKGTLVKRLLEEYDNYALSISMTTRMPRPGEEHGKSYFFVTKEEFQSTIERNGLLEYAQYCDNFYGTPKAYVEEQLANGKDVILEIEVQGALQIKEKFPETLLLFVTPPSAQVLKDRLAGRGTETEEVINKRMRRAAEESESMSLYDNIIVNDDLEECVKFTHNVIQSAHSTPDRVSKLIANLKEELSGFSKGE
ncbi:MAG: guanylate kinase [Lachnospiraceae bacterium]|nr:guanylate kinase [Lachnospiraceae bacterium]